MEQNQGVNVAGAFLRLVGRAARGLTNTKLARCARCQTVRQHRVVAEIESTQESIYECEHCGMRQCL